jgi:hypothetical protein
MSELLSKAMDVLHCVGAALSIGLQPIWSDWRVAPFFVIAIALIGWNVINRARWDVAWTRAGNHDYKIPERRWTYDAQDLDEFVRKAGGDDPPLLEFYRCILRGSDLAFAIAVAAMTAYIWGQIAIAPVECVWLNWAALPLGAMGVLYGIADVAEDLKLSAILEHPDAIDQAETAATNILTRVKLVTICLSLIGAVIFLLYSLAEICAVWLLSRFKRRQATA